jgi:hypothetical protein
MQHGLNDVELQDNLFICRPKGAFNLEGVTEYETKFAQMAATLKGQSWGIINVYDDYEAGGPDVQKRIWSQFNWSALNGCDYIGFVAHNPLHEFAAKHTTSNIPIKEMRTFKNEADAFTWIKQALKPKTNL